MILALVVATPFQPLCRNVDLIMLKTGSEIKRKYEGKLATIPVSMQDSPIKDDENSMHLFISISKNITNETLPRTIPPIELFLVPASDPRLVK